MTAAAAPWAAPGRAPANALTPIRLALAVVVIASHSFPISGGVGAAEPLMRLTGQATAGDVAVGLFLAISGYLVAASRESTPTAGAFLAKRALRVYPGFLALTAAQALIVAPLACRGFAGYDARQVGLIALEAADLVGYGFPYGGLPTPFPGNPLPGEMNGSLWTIRYEFLCYLLVVVAWPAIRRAGPLAAMLAAALAAQAAGWAPAWPPAATALLGGGGPWPRLLGFFLAGALFWRLRGRIPRDGRLAALSALALLGAGAARAPALALTLPLAGVYLLLWAAYAPGPARWAARLPGDASYGAYLYGFPIQQSVMMASPAGWAPGPVALAAISAPLAVAAGALSWRLVERPCLVLKPGRRRPGAAG